MPGRSNLLQRGLGYIWPNTATRLGCSRAILHGYIAFTWIAFGHLFDVMYLYAVMNNLRVGMAKLPPLDFSEYFNGNTLAQGSVALGLVALLCLAIAVRTKAVILFGAAVFWMLFQGSVWP